MYATDGGILIYESTAAQAMRERADWDQEARDTGLCPACFGPYRTQAACYIRPGTPSEHIIVCPRCGSSDVEETTSCAPKFVACAGCGCKAMNRERLAELRANLSTPFGGA